MYKHGNIKKLVVLIPAYNEEERIADAIKNIPSNIKGVQDIETVVIDDGSTDKTSELAKKQGLRHIIVFNRNRGCGSVFRDGISYALGLDADIVVNIDADLQYKGEEIEKIIKPLLEQKADLVIGNRHLSHISGYPLYKLFTQSIANVLVSVVFKIKAEDVTSGFRAFSKEALCILEKRLKNSYTFTLESICVLAKKRLSIVFVPVDIRYPTRKSRLIRSKLYYAVNFLMTLIRCFFTKY